MSDRAQQNGRTGQNDLDTSLALEERDPSAAKRKANEQAGDAAVGRIAQSGPTLRIGASGPDVERLQALLKQHGGDLAPDGQFGPKTAAAVKSFQRQNGLAADGIVGPQTWQALGGGGQSIQPGDQESEEKKKSETQDGPPKGQGPGQEQTGAPGGPGGGPGGAVVPKELSGSRAAIVAVAKGELGNSVAARLPGDVDETGKATRQGWQRLLDYFTVAYGGTLPSPWMHDIIKYHKFGMGADKGGLQSWCAIFANWACKTAGVAVPNWKVGGTPLGPFTTDPQPGDIGYFAEHQHHCVIISVEGDRIVSIDGNSGVNSSVVYHERSRSAFTGFMKVPA